MFNKAKLEDIRNCQWYNDNNIASDEQIKDPNFMSKYVFCTLSRYARKLRRHLEIKARTALQFLAQKMKENPDILIALSGWGESELNYNRINHSKPLQDYFCDYSPFAVLEFRDWIQHTGLYAEGQRYAGQGYPKGGKKYQGLEGLARFNKDFGTNFKTWDLKYFNWSLDDDYDLNPLDDFNSDPNRIPFEKYVQNGMMPTSGPNYIEGGFDPPRVMKPGDKFWDLWNLFRETMVHNFVKDVAEWAARAGIPPDRWYSHQIPADCLFGTSPDMPYKNPRYYTSASPIWTADNTPYGSPGATVYDIKFPGWIARTSLHAVPILAKMSSNWAALEYDPEAIPPGYNVTLSPPQVLYEQMMRLYNYGVHFINFFKWIDYTGEHRYKGTNREIALRMFVKTIKDKPRQSLSVNFEPPPVQGIEAKFIPSQKRILIKWNDKIWSNLPYKWDDWGEFSHFSIHRDTKKDFMPNEKNKIAEVKFPFYFDSSIKSNNVYYYKILAVTKSGLKSKKNYSVYVNLKNYR